MLTYILLILFSYGLGSVPSLWFVGVRERRPVYRRALLVHIIGIKRSVGVVGIDFAKGFVTTFLGLLIAGWSGACLSALAVNAGAILTARATTNGTAAGALLVLSPLLLLVGLGVFFIGLILTEYVSVSVILSTIMVLIFVFFYPPSWLVLLCILVIGGTVLYFSFRRMISGMETTFPIRRFFR